MYGTAQQEEQLTTFVTIDEETVELWLKSGYRSDGSFRPGWGKRDFSEAVARVNRGSALLDEQKQPKWIFGVIPEKLDMSCASLCIIGQSYGDFGESIGIPFGMEEMALEEELADKEQKKLDKLAISHGFLTFHGETEQDIPYGVLDRVWVYMLTERHNRGGEPIFLAMPELN